MNRNQLKNYFLFFLKIPRVIYAHYGITHRCNLDCKMCKAKQDIYPNELSLDKIKYLVQKLADIGIGYVSIGGGEPLLREDIVKIVKLFTKAGIRVRILTNGVLLNEELLSDFKRAGLKDISISLDTLDAEKYKFITSQDVFNNVIDSIKMVNKILRKGVWLLNCVVSKLNFQELPQILKFAGRNNFLLSLVPIEDPQGKFSFLEEDYETIDDIFEILIKDRTFIFNSKNFLEQLKDYLKGRGGNLSCYAGRLYVSITPDGSITICHKYDIEYESQKAGFYRELVMDCSGCLRPCWREIDFAFENPLSLLRVLKFSHL